MFESLKAVNNTIEAAWSEIYISDMAVHIYIYITFIFWVLSQVKIVNNLNWIVNSKSILHNKYTEITAVHSKTF